MKVKKSIPADVTHLRGNGRVPEALLGAVVTFSSSGKTYCENERLINVSNSQFSSIIKRFENKEPLEGGKSIWKPKK